MPAREQLDLEQPTELMSGSLVMAVGLAKALKVMLRGFIMRRRTEIRHVGHRSGLPSDEDRGCDLSSIGTSEHTAATR